ncbi:hypothetical protein cyc_08964 [Cyclospora cayetanensis]|uniref:Transmembrane protein n=1 Tax=Cyclospora cayetanensis TaxID=88456 RepID=A0A1D3CX65_9EIME|nr:hypothetical protein cyc_08964 [Cyclospora cayetanensis]
MQPLNTAACSFLNTPTLAASGEDAVSTTLPAHLHGISAPFTRRVASAFAEYAQLLLLRDNHAAATPLRRALLWGCCSQSDPCLQLFVSPQEIVEAAAQQQIAAEGGSDCAHLAPGSDSIRLCLKQWFDSFFGESLWWTGWDGSLRKEALQDICNAERFLWHPGHILSIASRSNDGAYLRALQLETPEASQPSLMEEIHGALLAAVGVAALSAAIIFISSAACRHHSSV